MRDIVAYFNSMLKHPNNDIKHTKGTVTVQNDTKTNKKQSLMKVINSLMFDVGSTLSDHCLQMRCHVLHHFGKRFVRKESLLKLNNYRIQIRIGIFTKIESISTCHTPNLSTKFHPNQSTTFLDILHTDKQTNETSCIARYLAKITQK